VLQSISAIAICYDVQLCRLECLMLHTGLAYNQRQSADVTTCALQGTGSSGGGPTYGAVNGDSSQQGSGSTTPLAFDYETRCCMQQLLLLLCPIPQAQGSNKHWFMSIILTFHYIQF